MRARRPCGVGNDRAHELRRDRGVGGSPRAARRSGRRTRRRRGRTSLEAGADDGRRPPRSRRRRATAPRLRSYPSRTSSHRSAAARIARVPFVVERISVSAAASRNSRGEAPRRSRRCARLPLAADAASPRSRAAPAPPRSRRSRGRAGAGGERLRRSSRSRAGRRPRPDRRGGGLGRSEGDVDAHGPGYATMRGDLLPPSRPGAGAVVLRMRPPDLHRLHAFRRSASAARSARAGRRPRRATIGAPRAARAVRRRADGRDRHQDCSSRSNVLVFLITSRRARSGDLNSPAGALRQVGPLRACGRHGDWWRLVTSAFLHGGLLHIGFNMLVPWWFGCPSRARSAGCAS